AAWHMDPPFPVPPAKDVPQPTGGADRNSIPLYDFPAQEIAYNFIADMPLRVSALRSLGAFANVFAIESFMDELAAATGTDPIEFRLRHLDDSRARAGVARAGSRPVQESQRGLRGDRRGRGRRDRARKARLRRGRRRPGHQSRRACESDRGRNRARAELDAQGAGAVRLRAGVVALMGRVSDPALRRDARGRGVDPEPTGGARAGCR